MQSPARKTMPFICPSWWNPRSHRWIYLYWPFTKAGAFESSLFSVSFQKASGQPCPCKNILRLDLVRLRRCSLDFEQEKGSPSFRRDQQRWKVLRGDFGDNWLVIIFWESIKKWARLEISDFLFSKICFSSAAICLSSAFAVLEDGLNAPVFSRLWK